MSALVKVEGDAGLAITVTLVRIHGGKGNFNVTH